MDREVAAARPRPVWTLAVAFLNSPALFYGAVLEADDLAIRSSGCALTALGFWGNVVGLAAILMGFASLLGSPAAAVVLVLGLPGRRFSRTAAVLLSFVSVLGLVGVVHFAKNFL